MKPALVILLLIAFTACSARNRQKKMANKPVTAVETAVTPARTNEQQHLYDMPLKGIIYWVKDHLHR